MRLHVMRIHRHRSYGERVRLSACLSITYEVRLYCIRGDEWLEGP